jgi:flagellar capping protein FliD
MAMNIHTSFSTTQQTILSNRGASNRQSPSRQITWNDTRTTRPQQPLNMLPNMAIFNMVTATSSNSNVVQIRGAMGHGANATISVSQIATTQRNDGRSTSISDRVEAGTHEFEITVDGSTHRVSFTTDRNMSSNEFQQRMAEAVNSANLGVTASVTVNGAHTTLSIETDTTGAGRGNQPRFELRDIQGSAVALTGISTIAQVAQNAIFIVNGERHTSSSNDVTLDNGAEITLLRASSSEVEISFERDYALTSSLLEGWVDNINAMLEAGRSSNATDEMRANAREIERMLQENRRELEMLGILISSDGTLSIDERRFHQSVRDGTAENVFRNFVNQRSFNVVI